jgi:SacI restriction endonuclease
MTFTSLHVDHVKAKKELSSALNIAKSLKETESQFGPQIKSVILGNHLTYRYILITNLLAKTVEPRVNALALQSGADFVDAFDSRSLCHKVFVPFERESLQGRLGRSNEPYLNKPARHKALSSDNAVRRGYDSGILRNCISILTQCTGKDAKAALTDALYCALRRPIISDEVVNIDGGNSPREILERFANLLVLESHEGETSALIAGLSFFLLSTFTTENLVITVHPVNQSGASSREVLDIDVFSLGRLRFTAEVKDKSFTKQDLEHAANKVRANGFDRMFFILGPRASQADQGDLNALVRDKTGVTVSTLTVTNFFRFALGFSRDPITLKEVWEEIVRMCENARFKQITTTYIKKIAREVGLIVAQ